MIEVGTSHQPGGSGKWELFFLILIPFGGLALAIWMYFGGLLLPDGRTHKGHMLSPPLSLDVFMSNELTPETLDNKWGLFVVVDGACDKGCQDILYQTRQAHIALNRNTARVSRFLITNAGSNTEQDISKFLEQEHSDIEILKGAMPTLEYKVSDPVRIFLSDPLGNVMLRYGSEHTGKQMLKDMEKLLKASRIG